MTKGRLHVSVGDSFFLFFLLPLKTIIACCYKTSLKERDKYALCVRKKICVTLFLKGGREFLFFIFRFMEFISRVEHLLKCVYLKIVSTSFVCEVTS